MANVRISQLPSLSTLQAADIFPVVDTNTTYNITAANIQGFMLSTAGNVTAPTYLGYNFSNPKAYNYNVSILGNVNGFLQGSITIGTAYNLTVPDTSTISVLTSNDPLGGGGGGGTSPVNGTNITASGYISAVGNITGGNLSVGTAGNITTGNISALGNIYSATFTGNVLSVSGNVYANTAISTAGNVYAANVITSGTESVGNLSATGNIVLGSTANISFASGFAFQQINGNLYLTYNGFNLVAFNNNGTIVASNNVTAFGTP